MKNKKKTIIVIAVIIILLVIAIFGYLVITKGKKNNNNTDKKDFSEYIKTDNISDIQENLINKNSSVSGYEKEYNSYVLDTKFLEYEGQAIFYREENEMKNNTFRTVLCKKDDNVEEKSNTFIQKCLGYIGEYDKSEEYMVNINSNIETVDMYTDIVNGRSVYQMVINKGDEIYSIDIYSQDEDIIAQFSYVIKVMQNIPENGVG